LVLERGMGSLRRVHSVPEVGSQLFSVGYAGNPTGFPVLVVGQQPTTPPHIVFYISKRNGHKY